MHTGEITSYFDVAQVTLYAFWIFFAGLIMYLRMEDKREGFPLLSDRLEQTGNPGYPNLPAPKTFLLHDGHTLTVPHEEALQPFAAVPSAKWEGSPFVPTGNPLVDGIGPASYANRADVPDLTYDDALPKIVPLRAAGDFFLAWEDPDPRGMEVIGADGVAAGTVVDAWIDRSEVYLRYLEIELSGTGGSGRVLMPMGFADIRKRQNQIRVSAILASQFADVPRLRNADTVTLLEEDKVSGYFGGGKLYATPERAEPLV